MWWERPELPKSHAEWRLLKWTFVLVMLGLAAWHFGWALWICQWPDSYHLAADGLTDLMLLAGVYVINRLAEWIVP